MERKGMKEGTMKEKYVNGDRQQMNLYKTHFLTQSKRWKSCKHKIVHVKTLFGLRIYCNKCGERF